MDPLKASEVGPIGAVALAASAVLIAVLTVLLVTGAGGEPARIAVALAATAVWLVLASRVVLALLRRRRR